MAIKVKAVERNVSFDKSKEKWAFVMQADLYSKLSQSKVIQEAALRSGIARGSINAAWDAIGEVIKAWATEGHAVAIPGLGSMRFGLRATSVADVNKVGSNLITSRRVIFVPNTEIKDELTRTSINITCYDRDGNVIKRVTSSDPGEVEDPDNENPNPPSGDGGGSGNTNPPGGSSTGGGGDEGDIMLPED
ncbi:MAG: DNA-binding protein [Bacteroidales bacterium]|nr:DNA-binding protein [Bacteroidales bacterium]